MKKHKLIEKQMFDNYEKLLNRRLNFKLEAPNTFYTPIYGYLSKILQDNLGCKVIDNI